MKKKGITRKLEINKETVVNMEEQELTSIKGGAITITCIYPLTRCICEQ